jgi:hypothetical protein
MADEVELVHTAIPEAQLIVEIDSQRTSRIGWHVKNLRVSPIPKLALALEDGRRAIECCPLEAQRRVHSHKRRVHTGTQTGEVRSQHPRSEDAAYDQGQLDGQAG